MNKKIYLIVALTIIAIGAVIFVAFSDKKEASQKTGEKTNASIILFFGKGCPHCENVDKFIQENKAKEKVSFEELEVFLNKDNAKLMEEKAKECQLDAKSLGVPFLWNSGKCFSGDVDIINFFKGQLGE